MHRFKRRALDALGLGGGAIVGEMRLAAKSNRALSIAGVKTIRRFAPDCLRVQVVGGAVQVDGAELTLRTIYTGMVEVSGRIDGIAFEMEPQEENL